MGVKGLRRHVFQELARFIGQEIVFPAVDSGTGAGETVLVIDLSAWAWWLYRQLLRRSPIWGVTPKELDIYVSRFVTMCRACRFEPVFVADGPSPRRKAATRAKRVAIRKVQAERYMALMTVSRGSESPPRLPPHLPAHIHLTLMSILASKGMEVVYAWGEADGLVARLARQRDGIVLCSDSDFFFLQAHQGGCRFAQLEEIVALAMAPGSMGTYTRVDACFDLAVRLDPGTAARSPSGVGYDAQQPRLDHLRLNVYDPSRLALIWKIPLATLPVVAAMMENDFSSDEYMDLLYRALGSRFKQRLTALLVMIRNESHRRGMVDVKGHQAEVMLKELSGTILSKLVLMGTRCRGRKPSPTLATVDVFPPPCQAKFDRLMPNILLCLQAYLDDAVDAEITSIFERSCGRQVPDHVDACRSRTRSSPDSTSLAQYAGAYQAGHLPAGLLALLGYHQMVLPEVHLVDPTLPLIEDGVVTDLYSWCAQVIFSGRRAFANTDGHVDELHPVTAEVRAFGSDPRIVPITPDSVHALISDYQDGPSLHATEAEVPVVLLPCTLREHIFCKIVQMPTALTRLVSSGQHSREVPAVEGALVMAPSLVNTAAAICLAIRDLACRSIRPWSTLEIQACVLVLCSCHLGQLPPEDSQFIRTCVRWVEEKTACAKANILATMHPSGRSLHLASSLSSVLLACHALHCSLLLPQASREGMANFDMVLFQQAVSVFVTFPLASMDGRGSDYAPKSTPSILLDCMMTRLH